MNNIIVITGATSGIGLELKKLYEKQNDIVINLSIDVINEDKNNIKCDVSDEKQVESAFKNIAKNYKKIDTLINNAGFGISGASELIDNSKARKMFDVNFFGVLYCTQNALKLMSKGSKIINISSATSMFPLPYRGLYCASKASVSMLSKSLRMELKETKINVVSICPGDTKTNFTKNRVKNFETNSKYGNNIKTATQKLDERIEKRMSVNYVAGKIFKITNKKRTKPEYLIGKKYKVFYLFKKLLPERLFNWILGVMFIK